MKKVLILIMLLGAFSAHADMNLKEIDNFVKNLNWKNAKTNRDNSMKVLPNALIYSTSEEAAKDMVTDIDSDIRCYPVKGKSYQSALQAAQTFRDELIAYQNGGKTVLDFKYTNSPYYVKINDSEAVCELK